MKSKSLLFFAALTSLAAPALSQTSPQDDPGTPREPLPYDRGYDKPQARTDAINAPNEAKRADLNASVAARGNTTVEGYYAEDIAAYDRAVRAHDMALLRDEARFQRQQRAYAAAMADWRVQVADCEDGLRAACRAPAPNPADYY